jgi:hypothetical protein
VNILRRSCRGLAAVGVLVVACTNSPGHQAIRPPAQIAFQAAPDSACVQGRVIDSWPVCSGDNCHSVVEVATTRGDTVVVGLGLKNVCKCLPGTGDLLVLSSSYHPEIHVCFRYPGLLHGRPSYTVAYWCEIGCVKMPSNNVLQPSAPREGNR